MNEDLIAIMFVSDEVAMAIEEQLMSANDTFDLESGASALRNSGDFFQQVNGHQCWEIL